MTAFFYIGTITNNIHTMNDFLGFAEVTKNLSQPLCKLLECVSAGCGKIYEPCHIKRMAKAKAHELNVIAESLRNNQDIPIQYQDGIIRADGNIQQNLAQRAAVRVGHQEMTKQLNIESVVGMAASELEKQEYVPDYPVDKDWMMRFFEYASRVNNEEIQKLWSKILTGEVQKPGSFSPRTLDVLRNLSRKEAELFHKISEITLNTGTYSFLYGDNDLTAKHGIDFYSIITLADGGLISATSLSYMASILNSNVPLFYNDEHVCLISPISEVQNNIQFAIYTLTQAGNELKSLIQPKTNNSFMFDVVNNIKLYNPNFIYGIYEVISNQNSNISYKTVNLLNT